jgi:hypothetical protein
MTTWLGRTPDVPFSYRVAARTQVFICTPTVVNTWLPCRLAATRWGFAKFNEQTRTSVSRMPMLSVA